MMLFLIFSTVKDDAIQTNRFVYTASFGVHYLSFKKSIHEAIHFLFYLKCVS